MVMVVLAAASGAPGVTTTSLGLVLSWPRNVLLADCDRTPSQAIQAGYLGGADLGGRGLGQLAKAHREARSLYEELPYQTVRLPKLSVGKVKPSVNKTKKGKTRQSSGLVQPGSVQPVPTQPDPAKFNPTHFNQAQLNPANQANVSGTSSWSAGYSSLNMLETPSENADHQVEFLPGFTHPGTPALMDVVWPDLIGAMAAREAQGIDTIIDAGRLSNGGLPSPMVMTTDLIILVTRTSLRALAALRLNLPIIQSQVDSLPGAAKIVLLLIGPGRPYTAAEIQDQFGIPIIAELPWDEPSAQILSDGSPEPKRWAQNRYFRAINKAVDALVTQITADRARVGRA